MVSIVCQSIFDASAGYNTFFAGTNDFAITDPHGSPPDVEMTLTGNINALLRDQLFKAHHDNTTATAPNQFEFKGADAAWIKLHKQLWNSAATNSTASANAGITDTYQYLTVAPDGDQTQITTWNQAWGFLVGYALDPQDTNGALIKASSIEAAVNDTAYSSSLLNNLYSSFSNVSSGPTQIDTLSASTNFLDALMIHLYSQYGCSSEFKRISSDPSDDFVSIALHENDQVSFWIKCTPVNAPQGVIRYMKMNLKQDSSEDSYSLSNAQGSFSGTDVQDNTTVTQDSTAAGNEVQFSMSGTLDSSVNSSVDSQFLVGAVGSSCKIMDFQKGSKTIRITISQDQVSLEVNQDSGNVQKDVTCNLPYSSFLGKTVTAKATYKTVGDNCDVSFSMVTTDGIIFEMPVTRMDGISTLVSTVLDGSWNTGAPDAWTSYDLQVAFFEIFSPQSFPSYPIFSDRITARFYDNYGLVAIDANNKAYASNNDGHPAYSDHTVENVKMVVSNYYVWVYLKNDGTVEVKGNAGEAMYGNPVVDYHLLTGGDTSGVDLTNIQHVFAGSNAFAAIKNDKTAVAWGRSGYGGNAPANLANVKNIYANANAFCAHHEDNSITVWGHNDFGGNIDNAPWTVSTTNVKTVFPTNNGFFAISSADKKPYYWGQFHDGFGSVTANTYQYTEADIKEVYFDGAMAIGILNTNNRLVCGPMNYLNPQLLHDSDTATGNMIISENVRKMASTSLNTENYSNSYVGRDIYAWLILHNDGKITVSTDTSQFIDDMPMNGNAHRNWVDCYMTRLTAIGVAYDDDQYSVYTWGWNPQYHETMKVELTSDQTTLINSFLNDSEYEYKVRCTNYSACFMFKKKTQTFPYTVVTIGQISSGALTASDYQTFNGDTTDDRALNVQDVISTGKTLIFQKMDSTLHSYNSSYNLNPELIGVPIKYAFHACKTIRSDVLTTETIPQQSGQLLTDGQTTVDPANSIHGQVVASGSSFTAAADVEEIIITVTGTMSFGEDQHDRRFFEFQDFGTDGTEWLIDADLNSPNNVREIQICHHIADTRDKTQFYNEFNGHACTCIMTFKYAPNGSMTANVNLSRDDGSVTWETPYISISNNKPERVRNCFNGDWKYQEDQSIWGPRSTIDIKLNKLAWQ